MREKFYVNEGMLFYNLGRKKVAICDGELILKKHQMIKNVEGIMQCEKLYLSVKKEKIEKEFIISSDIISTYLESSRFRTDCIANGLIFSPETPKAEKYLATYVLSQLENFPTEEVICLEQGLSIIEGKKYFLFGDNVLKDKDSADVMVEARNPLSLRDFTYGNRMLGRENFLQTIVDYIEVDNLVCPMLTLYSVFSALQDFYVRMAIPQRFILVLEGMTGELKSSAARVVTNVFSEIPFLTFASSLRTMQNSLDKLAVAPVLLDDVNKASYSESTRRRGVAFTEIVQVYSERAPVEKMHGTKTIKLNIHAGLIVTAEEIPSNPSTVNRCIIIPSSTAIDRVKLGKVQERVKNYNVFAEFYLSLVNYVIKNYSRLEEAIQTNYRYYREKSRHSFVYDEKEVAGFNRVITSYALLMTTSVVLREYFVEQSLASDLVSSLMKKINDSVKSCCTETMERLLIENKTHKILDAIYDLYNRVWECGGKIARSCKKYFNSNHYSVGFLEDEVFYIQGKVLREQLNENVYSMLKGQDISLKEISSELRRFGLVRVNKDGKCSQQPPGTVTKKRFYAIRIYELEKIAMEFWKSEFPGV